MMPVPPKKLPPGTGRVDEVGQVVDILGEEKLMKKCLQVGTGTRTPKAGAKVVVHYVGTLTSGTKFDSSRDRGEPIDFVIGQGQVIKGWDYGIATMRKGERAELSIDHTLAYGEDGKVPTIPPKATLVFDVELLSWETYTDVSEKKNLQLMKDTIAAGEGYQSPSYESEATITIHSIEAFDPKTGSHEDDLDEMSDVEKLKPVFPKGSITVGDEALPPLVELAIKTMHAGETSRFVITNYGRSARFETLDPKIPPETNVVKVIISLHDFKKRATETGGASDNASKLKEAHIRKEEGNVLYKAKELTRASAKYLHGLTFVDGDVAELKNSPERLALLNNLAAVQIELQDYATAAATCTKALNIDKRNLRALQRRAKAYRLNLDFKDAIADAQLVLQLDPNNAQAKAEIDASNKGIKAAKAKDRQTYSGMFDKLSKKPERHQPVIEDPDVEKPKPKGELEFNDNVPRTIYVNRSAHEPAVGTYHLNTKETKRSCPIWVRETTSEDPEDQWRIFSDPHGRWKLGIEKDMDAGVGYVKAAEVHNNELMPSDMDEWLYVRATGDWEKDAAAKVTLSPTKAGPEEAD